MFFARTLPIVRFSFCVNRTPSLENTHETVGLLRGFRSAPLWDTFLRVYLNTKKHTRKQIIRRRILLRCRPLQPRGICVLTLLFPSLCVNTLAGQF